MSRKDHMPIHHEDSFFKDLPLHTRAVIFLKERWKWKISDIEIATDLDKNQVMLAIHEGRGLLHQGHNGHTEHKDFKDQKSIQL